MAEPRDSFYAGEYTSPTFRGKPPIKASRTRPSRREGLPLMSWHNNPHQGSPTFEQFHRVHESHRDGDKFNDDFLTRRGFTATYSSYDMPDGTLRYQSCRYEQTQGLRPGVDMAKKRFLLRRPVNPKTFDRQYNIGDCVFAAGARRIIFNWPAVMRAGPGTTVFVCEGEKNAADLIKNNILATTVLSHDWTDECVAALTGYDLIILE